jgi:hypothetical protein
MRHAIYYVTTKQSLTIFIHIGTVVCMEFMCAGHVLSVRVVCVLRLSVPPYVAYVLLGLKLECFDPCHCVLKRINMTCRNKQCTWYISRPKYQLEFDVKNG